MNTYFRRLLFLIFISLMCSFAFAEQFNPAKPGYKIGKALEDLTVQRTNQYLEDLRLAAKYATSSRESDLALLAQDFLGCALSSEGTDEKCRLKGKLSRYGYYEPLAVRLSGGLRSGKGRVGILFRCAVDELQGTKTHDSYLECLAGPKRLNDR